MNLSKSKYCNGVQCPKILWLDKYRNEEKEELNNESVLDNGVEVGRLAKNLLGKYTDVEYNSNLNIMIDDTKKLLKNDNIVITEASFLYNNNFCSVDLLKKHNNEYEIYEVKSSTKINDIYIDDISYQYYILNNLGYKIRKCFIVYINNSYIRCGDLELDKLFSIVDVTDKVNSKQKEVKENIININRCVENKKEPSIKIGIHCLNPYECPYFKYCTKALKKPNVFNVARMSNKEKFSLYEEGKYTYETLINEDINFKYKQQIDFELNNREPFIDKLKIENFLDTLTYPLYFLDFETYQQPVPLFDGVKPYQQIPFQYSLHYIEKEGSELKHKEYLALPNVDPRRELAERLVKDIPMNVCTLAYNMTFEKMVIKSLANLYPDLKEHLMNIYNNMKDLMIPFINRDYYVKEMLGSYSIKYVLPALFPNDPSLDYHNLEMIHNGGEAMSSYSNMGNLSKEEQEKLRYNLLKYCELDTFAMVKIWYKLKEVISK